MKLALRLACAEKLKTTILTTKKARRVKTGNMAARLAGKLALNQSPNKEPNPMNTNAKHTQLPWAVSSHYAEYIECHPDLNNGYPVAECKGPQDQANAEFIVRAVNSHYELVGACKSALRALKDNLCPGPMDGDAIKALEIVLTSAQGKEN